jgi:hypothetical protein
MATVPASALKREFVALTGDALMRAPVSVLLGVDAAAQAALLDANVGSVFDLGASAAFAVARRLVRASEDPALPESRQQAFAAEDVAAPAETPVAELARQPLTVLRALRDAALPLAQALGVANVRELAAWPPSLAARSLVAETLGADRTDIDEPDSEPAKELVPGSGIFPTERVSMRRLVIDQVSPARAVQPLEQLASPIDVATLVGSGQGFTSMATGALLHFSQSWFSQGVTLGQLMHSLSLAPGESTRMAMVDWTRRSSGSSNETLAESEALSNTQQQSRSLSEVTRATTSEVQTGSSSTETDARTSQSGRGIGLEIGPLAFGGSSGSSTTTTESMTVSTSFGSRDMAARTAQHINERTQQHASAARNRRSSVVRELSQSEHESLSTRVVTNYNHMHTLNLQYYEVVQCYRVTTQLERVERCLFVPVKPLDFAAPGAIERWRDALTEAALTGAARRQLLLEQGVVEVAPASLSRITLGDLVTDVAVLRRGASNTGTVVVGATGGAGGREPGAATGGTVVGNLPDITVGAGRGTGIVGGITPGLDVGGTRPVGAPLDRIEAVATRFEFGPAGASTTLLANKGFDIAQLSRLAAVGGRSPSRRGADSVFVAEQALLLGATLVGAQAAKLQALGRDGNILAAQGSGPSHLSLAAATPLGDLSALQAQPRAGGSEQAATLRLQLQINGAVLPLDVPVRLPASGAVLNLVRFGVARPSPELVRHLQDNRQHYTHAVLAGLDAPSVAGLLSRHTYRGLPLGAWVDPKPVALVGNALVFVFNLSSQAGAVAGAGVVAEEQAAFRAFLVQRGLNQRTPQSDLVALPTGGVFAEAVLGRSLAAEKVDLTRFWNWQDSPIPIAAPEIAALQAGSRNRDFNLAGGGFANPLVRQATPVALPAPTGLAPLLAALASGGPFRDMSGAIVAGQLAVAATQATGRAATAGSAQAAANLKTVMEQNTARMRIAADLVKGQAAAKSAAQNQGAGKGTPTERGAQLNAAQEVDKAKDAAASGASAGSGQAPASLEKQTLDGITGRSTEQSAQALVEGAGAGATDAAAEAAAAESAAAASGGSGASQRGAARRRRRTASPPTPATPEIGLDDLVNAGARLLDVAASGPRTFTFNVVFDDSTAPGLVGTQARAVMTAADGSQMASSTGSAPGSIRLSVRTEQRPASISVAWGNGAPFLLSVTGRKASRKIPVSIFRLLDKQQEVSERFVVKPVLRKFAVPVNGLTQLDAENAVGAVLASHGLQRRDVVGSLKIEADDDDFASSLGFGPGRVTFRVLTGELTILN